ncbi:formimidoylglutamate deiminase [Prauserella muralis]|uniref:Formimidoylglutamate deiminase n=1 Tax=Prauserella muralis TaxID=588067 RepID=A0A2V4BBT2_9PSEU|nr:formimidoylglutamate deiminase [Prauserella muralis]PXY32854.1 formimidoylglutamate deiminase [Prauserella muralis]
MTSYWCEQAWLPGGVASGVRVDIAEGRITGVSPDQPRTGTVLSGLTMPGFANAHSHAFHRALRGRTHGEQGTFWTWRERMYALAGRLDPDSYHRLARGVYAELVLAGYTSVGEFHYLHHAPGGARYADENAMSAALVAAAADAGIRLTLLDTCYLSGGFGKELAGPQLRFGDGDAQAWAERVSAFRPEGGHVVLGAAVHSVRAVPEHELPVVAAWARGRPLHVHLSEQRAENTDCAAASGRTPSALLADAGVLGPRTVAVHATHLTGADISALAGAGTWACFCPTTERDLGDGIGPARALADAGVRLCLGSDSHAVVDAFEETRALELDERLASQQRGRFAVTELRAAATGHAALGWDGAGAIEPGAHADLVTVDLGSVRTAGSAPDGVFYAASAADVTDVLVAGRRVVRDRAHVLVDRPHQLLATEIGRLWS